MFSVLNIKSTVKGKLGEELLLRDSVGPSSLENFNGHLTFPENCVLTTLRELMGVHSVRMQGHPPSQWTSCGLSSYTHSLSCSALYQGLWTWPEGDETGQQTAVWEEAGQKGFTSRIGVGSW